MGLAFLALAFFEARACAAVAAELPVAPSSGCAFLLRPPPGARVFLVTAGATVIAEVAAVAPSAVLLCLLGRPRFLADGP